MFESPGVSSDPQWRSPSLARTHPHLSKAALQCACLFAAIPRPRRQLLAKVPSDFYHCENSLLPISGLSGAYEYTLQSREGKQVTRELAWGQKQSPQVQKKKKKCCSVSSPASTHRNERVSAVCLRRLQLSAARLHLLFKCPLPCLREHWPAVTFFFP